MNKFHFQYKFVYSTEMDCLLPPYTHSTDIVSKAEIFAIADSLSTLSLEKLTVFVRGLGLSGDQLTERMKHATQHLVIAEVLLEFSDRTACHVRRRLGQILLNNGHWREALKIYPQGFMISYHL